MEKIKKRIVLTEYPLTTRNKKFLEDILNAAAGYESINAVLCGTPPVGFAVPSNSNKEPLNEYLPGGIIIRARYRVDDICTHYKTI